MFQERLYVAGGEGERGDALKTVQYLDESASSWKSGPAMSVARNWAGAVVFQEKLYVIGGRDDDGHSLDATEYLDVGKPAPGWKKSAATMKSKRAALAVAVFQERLYAIGGYDGVRQDTIEWYGTAPKDLKAGSTPPSQRPRFPKKRPCVMTRMLRPLRLRILRARSWLFRSSSLAMSAQGVQSSEQPVSASRWCTLMRCPASCEFLSFANALLSAHSTPECCADCVTPVSDLVICCFFTSPQHADWQLVISKVARCSAQKLSVFCFRALRRFSYTRLVPSG